MLTNVGPLGTPAAIKETKYTAKPMKQTQATIPAMEMHIFKFRQSTIPMFDDQRISMHYSTTWKPLTHFRDSYNGPY